MTLCSTGPARAESDDRTSNAYNNDGQFAAAALQPDGAPQSEHAADAAGTGTTAC